MSSNSLAELIDEMANQVVQVILRCETASETEHLGNPDHYQ